MQAYQRLKADNDRNGNPRRLIVTYDLATGGVLRVIDEGYAGYGRTRLAEEGIPADAIELPSGNVSASEYGSWLRLLKT